MMAHRGKSKPKQRKAKPKELVATSPNQIWSWDITYLKTNIKGRFYYLYMIMDIFSRKIVGFRVHEEESASHSAELIHKTALKENITYNSLLTLHSDNGSPMKGSTMLAKLHQLGVAPSFSRPSVSNDNAYSESLFKTLKYCPKFPEEPFDSIDKAEEWVAEFVNWYNTQHLHSGIKYISPQDRHIDKDKKILKNRIKVYEKAKAKNPARWSGNIRNWKRDDKVYLNKVAAV